MREGGCALVKFAISAALDMPRRSLCNRSWWNSASSGRIPDQLVFVEHPHVITLGRNGQPGESAGERGSAAPRRNRVSSHDRGGDITYHGPGQIVGYPIFDLREWKRDVVAYVRAIEQVIIDALGEFGIEAGRLKGCTGVWVEGKKVAAIGVHVSRWVTSHGFALNHTTDLSYFQYIVPCGLTKPVTSMRRTGIGREPGRSDRLRWREISQRNLEFELLAKNAIEIAATMTRLVTVQGDILMTDVVMPQMGESIVEGTLTKWLKKPGEHVERDEPLFEISTDKVDTEIPAPAAGVLKEVLVEEGKTVAISTVVGRIDESARQRSIGARAGGCKTGYARRHPSLLHCQQASACPGAGATGKVAGARTAEGVGWHVRTPVASARATATRGFGGSRAVGRTAFAAGSQDGARIWHRSASSERHRRGRPHHQAGSGSVHVGARRTHDGAGDRAHHDVAERSRDLCAWVAGHLAAADVSNSHASGGSSTGSRRADEHHARQDRRAHGHEQANCRRTSRRCTRPT